MTITASGHIPGSDLAVVDAGSSDYVLGVQLGKVRRFPLASLPFGDGIEARLSAVEQGQIAGMVGVETLADLPSDAPLNSLALVTNDPVQGNNGVYRKTGASSWAKSADRVSELGGRMSDAERLARYGALPTVEYNSANPAYFTTPVGFTRTVVGEVLRFEPDGATASPGYFSRSGLSINPTATPIVKYRVRRTRGTAARLYVLYVVDSSGAGYYYGQAGKETGALLDDDGDWVTYEVDISTKPDGTAWGNLTIAQLWVSLSARNGDSAWEMDYLAVGKPQGYTFPEVQAWRAPDHVPLERMADDLSDPLKSVTIQLIGDSITWGVGATGSVADASGRNLLTNNTWANLLHKWLGESFADGVLSATSGTAEYRHTFFIPLVNAYDRGAPRRLFTRSADGAKVPLETAYNASAFSDYIAQFRAGGAVGFNGNAPVEFEMVGDNLTVVYSPRNASDVAGSIVELWGNGQKLGEFSYYGTTAWGAEHTFSFPMGRYTMRLVNKSLTNTFVLEGLKHDRLIKVMNEGVSGSSAGSWTEGSAYLTAALAKYADYVFVQLGTNDRVGVDPWVVYFFLTRTVKALQNSGRAVILMAANAVEVGYDYPENATYKFGQRDVARVTKRVAFERGASFIDNHQATVMKRINGETFTADGLHPNDAGYRLMFDSIRASVLEHFN